MNFLTKRSANLLRNFTHSQSAFSMIPKYRGSSFQKTDEERKSELRSKEEILKTGKWTMPHPQWSEQEVKNVSITHLEPANLGDRFADLFIKTLRYGFDIMSGYKKIFPW